MTLPISFLIICLSLLLTVAPPLFANNAAIMQIPTAPMINARSYLLEDFHSGQILMQKNATERVEPASITKVMTAYVLFDALKNKKLALTDTARISDKAWRAEGSRMYVNINTEVSIADLLRGMIVQSGNDATIALAEKLTGSEEAFVILMNQKAAELGLKQTHYMNTTGLPHPDHYTTATDIATLGRQLIIQFPDYYKIYSEKEFTYNNIKQGNRNVLLWRDSTVDGLKTGHTESAGYCLIASAKRGEMRLISVVMGTENMKARTDESEKMLNYGFSFYETYQVFNAKQVLTTERVWQGIEDNVPLGLNETLYITIPKDQYNKLSVGFGINKPLYAPLLQNQTVGILRIMAGQQTVVERPLVALKTIDNGGLWKSTQDTFLLWFQ